MVSFRFETRTACVSPRQSDPSLQSAPGLLAAQGRANYAYTRDR